MPDVADRPVVKRGRRVSVLKLLGNPAFSTITVFLVAYIGFGTGRIIPKSRIGFTVECGVQLHKSPKVYTNYGTLGDLGDEADNDFNKIMDFFCVYPVVKLRLCGRIF